MDITLWLKKNWKKALLIIVALIGLAFLSIYLPRVLSNRLSNPNPTIIYDPPVITEQPVVYDENPEPILASSPEDDAGAPPITSYDELGGYEGFSDEALSDDGWNFSLSLMSAARQSQPEVPPPSQVSQAALYLAQQHWNDSIRSERDPYMEFSFEQ